MTAFLRAALAALGLLLCIKLVLAHGVHTSPEENEWMNRQHSVSGTKCCDERDVSVGIMVNWRINVGTYEVQIGDRWVPIGAENIMANVANDPSPFGGQALLFYSIIGDNLYIWCFRPENLM